MKTGPKPVDPVIRFWRHFTAENDTDCWLWTGSISKGYGKFFVKRGSSPMPAHVFAWQTYVGPVPEGLELDHLCRVRNCVNPAHLQPVMPRVNKLRGVSSPAENARKTHCEHGHEFTHANTYWWRGQRKCLACQKSPDRLAYQAAYRAAHREKQKEYMRAYHARQRSL